MAPISQPLIAKNTWTAKLPDCSHPRMPAVGPSWEDAVAFCAWTAGRSGMAARLPTEAEWELAARAGVVRVAAEVNRERRVGSHHA